MSNIYHILYKLPALEKEEMYYELEELAVMLVESGKMRIDTIDKINYARFTIPDRNISIMFSKRELRKPELLKLTKQKIYSFYQGYINKNLINRKIDEEIIRLRAQIKKHLPVSRELEMKLARLIVQSAHPVVILLLLIEKVEIFISYSYNIGDMMDIVSWQRSGENSGMQSTNGRDVAIFTSSGGDPFAKGEKDTTFGDGIPALSRMMVIAGQEIGHYSDILRDKYGRQISRHSANFSGTKAQENVRIARIKDLVNLDKLTIALRKIGMNKLFEYERHLKFYIKNKRPIIAFFATFKIYLYRLIFFRRARKAKINFILKEKSEKYLASKIMALIEDMKFNLAPVADVYKSDNKQVEEAIACIEALARVPQQRLKWGPSLTYLMMNNLYIIYYNQVIPSCIEAYKNITGKKYDIKLKKRVKPLWLIKLKKLFKKKPKMHKSWEY